MDERPNERDRVELTASEVMAAMKAIDALARRLKLMEQKLWLRGYSGHHYLYRAMRRASRAACDLSIEINILSVPHEQRRHHREKIGRQAQWPKTWDKEL